MNNPYIAKCVSRNSLYIIFSLSVFSCNKYDQETTEKLTYWDKQAEIMTLVGRDKSSVFGWVYAIDKNAIYKGDSLVAIVERLQSQAAPNRCIKLTIKFDERERVSEHIVSLVDKCITS
jgi:hypothetical protein